MTPPRAVVVDDHPVFRGGLVALLTAARAVDVVAEAATGEEAIAAVDAHRPDVVVMDLRLPGGINGVQATRAIRAVQQQVRVLVLSMADDDESVFAALRAGAAGYVLKDAEPDDVVAAVQAVARGGAVFGPAVAVRLQDLLSGAATPASPFPQLTAREAEVLDLLAAGLDNAVIARRLGVAQKTVRNAVSSIFAKLHVADRGQAIVRARDAGLGRGLAGS